MIVVQHSSCYTKFVIQNSFDYKFIKEHALFTTKFDRRLTSGDFYNIVAFFISIKIELVNWNAVG